MNPEPNFADQSLAISEYIVEEDSDLAISINVESKDHPAGQHEQPDPNQSLNEAKQIGEPNRQMVNVTLRHSK
jgi:hypothetical protein